MADSDSSVSDMEGSISSGEVWSTLSEDWEISSEETDPEETFRERVDYSSISHHTRGQLAKSGELENEDLEEEDSEEEDPIKEDSEEEDPEENPMEDEDPAEEPMEWEFEVAPEPLLGEILEGVPLGWDLDLDEEDWAWEDEPMVEDPTEGDEQEEISLDGSEPQPTEASDTESTSSSPSTSS
ncbi:glutamic acid-rich protein-like [Asparagus officinalis]|uniref:glutamic acid-rich protein-like n=1 Tax=Asparagus officinalis TaxID=4686 RepID=UPI00098E3E4E|nr:glutamic acid-rich protein-like [Asparagus officinalis]